MQANRRCLTLILAILAMTIGSALAGSRNAVPRVNAFWPTQTETNAAFYQERRIGSLSRPLVSSGCIQVYGNGTLAWAQQKPFAITLKIGPDSIEESVVGQPSRIVTEADNPYLVRFSKAFSGLFSGNITTLVEMFELHEIATDVEATWHFELTPRSADIGQAISTIQIKGSRQIESILIEETSGNSTAISLVYGAPQCRSLPNGEE